MTKLKVETVKTYLNKGRVYFTDHSNERMEERDIDLRTILYKVKNGKIVDAIESFDTIRNAPACLVFLWYQEKPAFVAFYYSTQHDRVGIRTVGWIKKDSNYWKFQEKNFRALVN